MRSFKWAISEICAINTFWDTGQSLGQKNPIESVFFNKTVYNSEPNKLIVLNLCSFERKK